MPDLTVVDLGKLAEPANTLIKKISGAIGRVYEPTHIRRIAKAQADADKTYALSRLEISEIERRGLERLVREEGKKQENIESVSRMALEHLTPDAKPEKMEDDWIVHLFEKVKLISDKHMQELWARILAGEANAPGKFSRRIVEIMSVMNKIDAEALTHLLRFSWSINRSLVPIVLNINDDIYKRHSLTFDRLLNLTNISMVSLSTLQKYMLQNLPGQTVAKYFNCYSILSDIPNGKLTYGICRFTETGRELASLCVAKPLDDFCEYVLADLGKQGVICQPLQPAKGQQ